MRKLPVSLLLSITAGLLPGLAEGDMMRVLDVLHRQVGIIDIFSDWPATVTFYANCVGRK